MRGIAPTELVQGRQNNGQENSRSGRPGVFQGQASARAGGLQCSPEPGPDHFGRLTDKSGSSHYQTAFASRSQSYTGLPSRSSEGTFRKALIAAGGGTIGGAGRPPGAFPYGLRGTANESGS